MKNIIFGTLLLAVSILMTGCGPFGTRAFHVPQLDEKGDFQANALFSASNGLEIQADYAWSERFYSPADFSFSRIQSGSSGYRSNAYSLGIGYYNKMEGAGRFNVYYTPMYGNFGNTGSTSQSHFIANAIGADLGWRFKHFEAAFSMKLENFAYFDSNINTDGQTTNIGAGSTMRFGGENLKFHMQIGLAYPIKYDNDVPVFPYVMNLGLNYRLNFKKK